LQYVTKLIDAMIKRSVLFVRHLGVFTRLMLSQCFCIAICAFSFSAYPIIQCHTCFAENFLH